MKSGKSVSLELKYWAALEEYRKKHGLPSISRALEEILEKFFEGGKGFEKASKRNV